MGLVITDNVSSLIAQNSLSKTQSSLSMSLERLSTGLKINSAADGPAALVISQEQQAQIVGLQTAVDNTSKAVSMVQTADGGLSTINDLLNKIRALAVDSANNAVQDSTALAANQAEISNALSTIDRIATTTKFGTKFLLDGSAAGGAAVINTGNNTGATGVSNAGSAQAGTYTVQITQQGVKQSVQAASNFAAVVNDAATTQSTAIQGNASITSATQVGAYNAQVATQGVKAQFTAGGAAGTEQAGGETLTVNGPGATNLQINLTAGQTTSQILTTIQNALANTGIDAQYNGSGDLVFTAKAFGAGSISVTTSATGQGSGIANSEVGTAGADLTVSINGGAAITGSGANGNTINVTSGAANGLSFQVQSVDATHTAAANATGSVVVTGNDTLTINGTAISLNAQNAGTISDAQDTINAQSATTGVTASVSGSQLVLTANQYSATPFTYSIASQVGNADSGFRGVGTDTATAAVALKGTINGGPTLTASGPNGNVLTSATGVTSGLSVTIDFSGATTAAANTTSSVTVNDGLIFQIGANQNETAGLSIQSATSANLGQGASNVSNPNTTSLADISVLTSSGAQDAIAVVDKAISDVSTLQGTLGAFQSNTLQETATNLQTTLTNTTAAQSVIRDTDFAAETSNYTKDQVLMQVGTTVLANSNALSQLVLGLFK